MTKPEIDSGTTEYISARVEASAVVSAAIIDCLIQTLMNKGLLLPSEVNDIFQAAGMLIDRLDPDEVQNPDALRQAKADIADRLGEST